MKSLIVTVAGMATRFSKSVGEPCLKCTYFRDSFDKSLLGRLINMNYHYFDKIIIVGGFMYAELEKRIQVYLSGFAEKLILLKNEHFFDYGSGYSLYLGMTKAISIGSTEIVFAEGDLYMSPNDFRTICNLNKDIVTTNGNPIEASKSVAFYFNKKEKIHYIFDTSHGELEIHEPFTEIRNSGQVWKFINMKRLSGILGELSEDEKRDTNLVIVQKYYGELGRADFAVINFHDWINCNTVSDFDAINELEEKNEEFRR